MEPGRVFKNCILPCLLPTQDVSLTEVFLVFGYFPTRFCGSGKKMYMIGGESRRRTVSLLPPSSLLSAQGGYKEGRSFTPFLKERKDYCVPPLLCTKNRGRYISKLFINILWRKHGPRPYLSSLYPSVLFMFDKNVPRTLDDFLFTLILFFMN